VKTLSIAVLSAVLAAAGCSSPPAPTPALGESPLDCAGRFEEPADYTLSYTFQGESILAGNYLVTVQDHSPVSFETIEPFLGSEVAAQWITLDTVFTLEKIVRRYLDLSASEGGNAHVTWDEETCFPSSASFDPYTDAIDDEYFLVNISVSVYESPADRA
jgi:hypothetical protein